MQILLCLAMCLTAISGFQIYQGQIPNGRTVPNPCGSGFWAGVGHIQLIGAGETNPFGADFAASDHTWTDALCRADSDGDGRSNGEELGDQHCHWTTNNNAHLDPASGHPGICELSDGSICAQVVDTYC